MSKEKIKELTKSVMPEVITDRRYFRQHPELSREEKNTQKYILHELEVLGIPARSSFNTGIIAEIKGNLPGKTVALRADMDALPLSDESGLPFASINKGICHACGHDAHMSVLLGAARVFVKLNGDFPGTIRFLFQPSEEAFDGGARHLVADGALENVDYILGNHIWQPQKAGTIGVTEGSMMASANRFQVTIQGKGGHASMPDLSINPIVIGADLISSMNQLVGTVIPSQERVVITTTVFQGGEAGNVIPDTAILRASIRTFNTEMTDLVETSLERLCQSTAEKYNATINYEFIRSLLPVINAPEPTAIFREAAVDYLGAEAVERNTPAPASEDFSMYQTVVPGTFFFLGTGDDQTCIYPHHHPKFVINEDVLENGVALMTLGAIRLAQS